MDQTTGKTPTAAVGSGSPGFAWARSLAGRVTTLVLLVLFASTASAVLVQDQLRSLQASFSLLTEVYVVFNERLARAQVQSVRIGEQVHSFAQQERLHQERLAPQVDPRSDSAFLQTFLAGLEMRSRLIQESRAPIDEAIASADLGGDEQLEDLRDLQAQLDDLERLAGLEQSEDLLGVLRDQRTQTQIERALQRISESSGRAILQLQGEVSRAEQRTEEVVVLLTGVVSLLGLLASFWVVWTLRPLRRLAQSVRRLGGGDWSQRIDLPVGNHEDEVTQLAREFNLMAEALQERERRLLRGERLAAAGQLAAQITHEIRNPLSSLALNAELLEDELQDAGPEAHRLLARITDEVDRLTAITEDYLGFARRPKPELSRIDLRDELQRLLDFLAEEHEQAGIAVVRELPDHPVWIEGDANQLRQAFMNLLRNAQEAVAELDPGLGRAPRIELRLQTDAAGARITVADNGPGIGLGADKLERIFEAFYTRKARGTGLGLPIVQQIVADHTGSVKVERTGPDGTIFAVFLPLAPARTDP